jgi:cell filamentation protein
MSDSYKYIDSEYSYIDPKSGVLRNLLDISNSSDLLFIESSIVTKRINELHEHPIRINGIHNLFEIHKHLFQDIYAWAGKKRIVEISKGGKQFFLTTNFDIAFQYIDSLITEYKKIPNSNKRELSEKLAKILDNINYLHPFRDGNGRTQREFLRLLALEKGLILNLNPPDNKDVYDRYMQGTIKSEVETLSDLIFELIEYSNIN